jgi:hypothetical protein
MLSQRLAHRRRVYPPQEGARNAEREGFPGKISYIRDYLQALYAL